MLTNKFWMEIATFHAFSNIFVLSSFLKLGYVEENHFGIKASFSPYSVLFPLWGKKWEESGPYLFGKRKGREDERREPSFCQKYSFFLNPERRIWFCQQKIINVSSDKQNHPFLRTKNARHWKNTFFGSANYSKDTDCKEENKIFGLLFRGKQPWQRRVLRVTVLINPKQEACPL